MSYVNKRKLFNRVLVANRGEIACRIISTLQHLGIEAVAVYSDADRTATHVAMADQAVRLGPAPTAQSYLNIDAVIEAARSTRCEAVHPGYGLLSESVEFAASCARNGIEFIGPTLDQIKQFGLKHTARELAERAEVPLVPGSGLLTSADAAVAAAQRVGYPVMVKASAGGGGIGMRRCGSDGEVREAFGSIQGLAENNFGDSTIFLERFVDDARHIEVQIFGDGAGNVITLGERDCSVQRRNQKIVEESPAPGVSEALRTRLCDYARLLAESVDYRSAGTVEFIVDGRTLDRPNGGDAWFLEVNTRLQVEHGVTELRYNLDLVEQMVRTAAGLPLAFADTTPEPTGAALEVRLYAEDPSNGFAPSPGLVTEVSFPDSARIDTWIRPGLTITPFYDPLIAKILVHAHDRPAAIRAMNEALEQTRISGVETNLRFLQAVLADDRFVSGDVTTKLAIDLPYTNRSIRVIEAGLFTTVQDLPGRLGYWDVGVPPSGPMDDLSFRLANQLVGNEPGAAALEITLTGPTLVFRETTKFVLGGAELPATLDDQPVSWWTVIEATAGSTLKLGAGTGYGARSVMAVDGGFDVPDHLGSMSTFVLGGFGGHGGRCLQPGDVLNIGPGNDSTEPGVELEPLKQPVLTDRWQVGVLAGPHAAPDYFTPEDIDQLYETEWEVHFNSDRTGVRLIGPKPTWARPDGGEAGLHPSNIHDNAYAIGTIDFTGDMPIVLGRDGPSLGGFVCPATVATSEFWKIGQARSGDTIRFVPIDQRSAIQHRPVTQAALEVPEEPILLRRPADTDHPGLTVRRDGDRNVLVEYGPNVLDILLRLRVGALSEQIIEFGHPAITEQVPGIRSLQIGFDPHLITPDELVDHIVTCDDSIGDVAELEIPSRIVRLPLSWDDPATRLATEKYAQTVRSDAPWCPWNLEFIRRINGLGSVDDVKRIVFDASYLVLGLGDVYLGAPVATPVDPRHRLVTTKYNPARTWTAENSVGIGGAYLCIYGMEGPGGYQFVGRTIQVWERWMTGQVDGFDQPWLLRFFDQIQWYEVGADELLDLRSDVEAGQFEFDITETTFAVRDYLELLDEHKTEITKFNQHRDQAFDLERQRWADDNIDVTSATEPVPVEPAAIHVPEGAHAVTAPIPGVVWKIVGEPGDIVTVDDALVILESMKMETKVSSSTAGTILDVCCVEGETTKAGQVLAIVKPSDDD